MKPETKQLAVAVALSTAKLMAVATLAVISSRVANNIANDLITTIVDGGNRSKSGGGELVPFERAS